MATQTENNGTSGALRRVWNNPIDKEQLAALEERTHELNLRARAFIRENPVAVVAAAVGIGFVVGRLLVRR
jgi:ElaB/YqjD/DUF883 family membrane-anchored ribosome-binding protein